MSTDLAHSLADSFDLRLGPEPGQIGPNLWAQETDIYYNLRTYWGRVQEWLNELLAWRPKRPCARPSGTSSCWTTTSRRRLSAA
jgi:anion-transporting  ArsA/GET3 family ATPase